MEPESEVSIPTPLLEELKSTLETAYYYSYTHDLQDGYRTLRKEKQSPLTQRLHNQVELLQSFIELANTEDTDESTGSTE